MALWKSLWYLLYSMIKIFWMSSVAIKIIFIQQRLSSVQSHLVKILKYCPEKTMTVKRIYDLNKNISSEVKRNQFLEYSLTSQSVCSSKNITHVIGRSVVVETIVYDNLKRLITQGYSVQFI